jgi:thioredoxin 1
MKTPVKIIIVLLVASAALAAVALKGNKTQTTATANEAMVEATVAASSEAAGSEAVAAPVKANLPKLVDLGASKCIPCKMMKPILDDLTANYADRFTTVFIDVWENREAGQQYGIRAIPTQIFYDAEGKELFRHEGFYGKDDILGKWKELGVDVAARAPATAATN